MHACRRRKLADTRPSVGAREISNAVASARRRCFMPARMRFGGGWAVSDDS